jgi:polysaccharide export outer membrane protein
MFGKMRCSSIYLLALLLVVASCAPYKTVKSGQQITLAPSETGRVNPTAPRTAYTLSEGDQVEIKVARQDSLTRTITIDTTGYISMPYAGEIQAGGVTVPQLRQEITTRLAKYFVEPQVDVNVVKVGGQQITVLGEVGSPGNFALDRKISAWQAIAMAGGFGEDANKRSVILLRTDRDVIRASILNLDIQHVKKEQDGLTAAQNVYLKNEDIIYVPPTKIADVQRFFQRIQSIVGAVTTLESAIVFGPEVLDALGIDTIDKTSGTGLILSQ